MDYYAASAADVARSLSTTPAGLDSATAKQRLVEYGKNEIQDAKKKTIWQMILHQLMDVMILILAAIVSGLIGELKSTYVILAIVVLNAIIGFVQEYRAEAAIEALKKMAANRARVIRQEQTIDVEAADLVPGDVTLLEAGNIIPADVRFVEVHALKVDESSLTGESANVDKNPDALLCRRGPSKMKKPTAKQWRSVCCFSVSWVCPWPFGRVGSRCSASAC